MKPAPDELEEGWDDIRVPPAARLFDRIPNEDVDDPDIDEELGW